MNPEGITSTGEVLRLIRRALDQFDEVPLDATIRRTVRIATLLGESRTAIRLVLDLRPIGGDKSSNQADLRRLLTSPDDDQAVGEAVEEWLADRKTDPKGSNVDVHTLAELEFWDKEPRLSDELTAEQFKFDLNWRLMRVQILARARFRAFTALCSWERQLSFRSLNEHLIVGHQRRLDELLAVAAPQLLDQFNAVYRRLETQSGLTAEEAAEELAQAVTTCRRILKAVVDHVQPARSDMSVSEDGHKLTDKDYKNRLAEFLKGKVSSSRFSATLGAAADALFSRFTALDALASKGVHARVAREEAEFCALNTWILAGEVVALAAGKIEPASQPSM